eukprot:COSAG06_NODE_31770_length_516_cov_0.438849_1_plen_160_part_10
MRRVRSTRCLSERLPTAASRLGVALAVVRVIPKKHHGFVVLYRRTASSIKAAIALGKPICFGFAVYESLETKEVAKGSEDGTKGPGWMPLPDGFKPDATAKDLAGSEGVEEKKDDAGNVIGYVTKDEDGNEVEVTDSMAQCAAISEKCMGGHAVAIVGYD